MQRCVEVFVRGDDGVEVKTGEVTMYGVSVGRPSISIMGAQMDILLARRPRRMETSEERFDEGKRKERMMKKGLRVAPAGEREKTHGRECAP